MATKPDESSVSSKRLQKDVDDDEDEDENDDVGSGGGKGKSYINVFTKLNKITKQHPSSSTTMAAGSSSGSNSPVVRSPVKKTPIIKAGQTAKEREETKLMFIGPKLPFNSSNSKQATTVATTSTTKTSDQLSPTAIPVATTEAAATGAAESGENAANKIAYSKDELAKYDDLLKMSQIYAKYNQVSVVNVGPNGVTEISMVELDNASLPAPPVENVPVAKPPTPVIQQAPPEQSKSPDKTKPDEAGDNPQTANEMMDTTPAQAPPQMDALLPNPPMTLSLQVTDENANQTGSELDSIVETVTVEKQVTKTPPQPTQTMIMHQPFGLNQYQPMQLGTGSGESLLVDSPAASSNSNPLQATGQNTGQILMIQEKAIPLHTNELNGLSVPGDITLHHINALSNETINATSPNNNNNNTSKNKTFTINQSAINLANDKLFATAHANLLNAHSHLQQVGVFFAKLLFFR